MTDSTRNWFDIDPEDARDLNLAEDTSITAPLNEDGNPCPWPWEPQQLTNAPLGQYRCPYCNAMVAAGARHPDYTPEVKAVTPENLSDLAAWSDGKVVGQTIELTAYTGRPLVAVVGDHLKRDGYGYFTVLGEDTT